MRLRKKPCQPERLSNPKKPFKCYIGQTLCQGLAYQFGRYHQESLLYSNLSVQLRFDLIQNVRVFACRTRIHAC